MKKLLLTSVLICLILTSAFAQISVNAGVGVLSNVGISLKTEKADFDLGFEKALPFLPLILSKAVPLINGREFPMSEYLKYSMDFYTGLDLGAYYKFAFSGKNNFYAGLNLKTAMVRNNENLDILTYYTSDYEKYLCFFLNALIKYKFDFDKHNSLFTSIGLPLAVYCHVYPVENDTCPLDILESVYIVKKLAETADIENGVPLILGGLAASTFKIGYSYSF